MMFREYFKVRRLSRQLGMPRATIRMMLAIESGRIEGDVVGLDPSMEMPGKSPANRDGLVARVGWIDRAASRRTDPETEPAAPEIRRADQVN